MAMGVLEALREKDMKVPRDVGVVGFDDIEMAGLPGVDLTTISQEKRRIGRMAVDMLVEKKETERKGHLARRVLLNPVLVIRETCGYRDSLRRATSANEVKPPPTASGDSLNRSDTFVPK
jgi:LacI family transcriptional regulator